MAESAITSPQAVSLAPDGTVEWAKNADTIDLTIMSVTKTFTAYYALEGLGVNLATSRTFVGGTPTATALGAGDVCTVEDLFYAAMLPSQNSAADNIAYAALGIGGHSSTLPGFMDDLETWYASEFGWTGFTLNTPSGLDTNIVSARMIGELLHAVNLNQPALRTIMHTYPDYETAVTGPNARTVTFTNNTNMSDVPEWRGSKGGSGSGTYAMGTFWEDANGDMHSVGIIGAPTAETRKADIMTIIADVVAELEPDPDPDPDPVAGWYVTRSGVLVPATAGIVRDGTVIPIS